MLGPGKEPDLTKEQLREMLEALDSKRVTKVIDRYGIDVAQLRQVFAEAIMKTSETMEPEWHTAVGTIGHTSQTSPALTNAILAVATTKLGKKH